MRPQGTKSSSKTLEAALRLASKRNPLDYLDNKLMLFVDAKAEEDRPRLNEGDPNRQHWNWNHQASARARNPGWELGGQLSMGMLN